MVIVSCTLYLYPMSKSRKNIALIILGGTILTEEESDQNAIVEEKDVSGWLKRIPEVNIIADIEPFFVLGEKDTEVNLDHWIKAGKIVAENMKNFDGFVITHHASTLLNGACAFSFMLQNPTKPIIFTGSQIPYSLALKANKKLFKKYKGLGIKANLINAVQMAIQGPAEVGIIFGNKLVRATQAIKENSLSSNLFDSNPKGILGTIDFGIKLNEQNYRQSKGLFSFAPDFVKNVSVVSMYPEENYELLEWTISKHPNGILIQSQNIELSKKLLNRIKDAQKEIPVVLHSHSPFIENDSSLLIVNNLTPEAALLKFMWALGQTKKANEIKTILEKNIANEILDQ